MRGVLIFGSAYSKVSKVLRPVSTLVLSWLIFAGMQPFPLRGKACSDFSLRSPSTRLVRLRSPQAARSGSVPVRGKTSRKNNPSHPLSLRMCVFERQKSSANDIVIFKKKRRKEIFHV